MGHSDDELTEMEDPQTRPRAHNPNAVPSELVTQLRRALPLHEDPNLIGDSRDFIERLHTHAEHIYNRKIPPVQLVLDMSDAPSNALASYNHTTMSIYVNPRKIEAEESYFGQSSSSKLRTTLAHEYAHHLDIILRTDNNGDVWYPTQSAEDTDLATHHGRHFRSIANVLAGAMNLNVPTKRYREASSMVHWARSNRNWKEINRHPKPTIEKYDRHSYLLNPPFDKLVRDQLHQYEMPKLE